MPNEMAVAQVAPPVKGRLFSNKELLILFLPLVTEYFLNFAVGLADSIMVAYVGEAAVSGVSLVDFVIQLLISLFAALATGGAVVAGQYLGKQDKENAKNASNQLVWFTGVVAVLLMAVVYLFRGQILRGLFGSIAGDVYANAETYMLIVTASIPFLAVYNCGAAIFRSMKNSNLPMKIMLAMNIVNIVGNAVMIYGLKSGVEGAAFPTLVSRMGAAVLIMWFALQEKHELHISRTVKHRFDSDMIKRILRIGVPYGFENGMLYFGRLLILSLVSTFGTAAIAANSVSQTLVSLQALPGTAIGLGMTVIVSRCIGLDDEEQARYYTKTVLAIVYVVQTIVCAALLAILPLILKIYGLSEQATEWTRILVWAHAIMMVIWPLGFTLPTTFRAAGDTKFPMVVGMTAMVGCRIILAYIFGLYLNMGVLGTWVAMFADWIVRAVLFIWRYVSDRWIKYRAI